MAQYGLLEVHNGENAQVDIVFLHGLRGDREKAWTKNGVVWPKDLLPDDIPASRIFLFGYDTNITSTGRSGPSKTEIHSDAEDVCAKLAAERLRTLTVDRPIIFVAHSLGGLVAAQILVDGEHKPENSVEGSIARNTRGMVFLGTPFRGSSAAKPAEAVRRVLQLFKVDTQRQTLKLLGVDSDRLGELNRAFPQVLNKRRSSKDIDHRIEASFFYETLKTSWGVGSVQIVEPESAQLHGCGDAAPIRADHIDICKFETKDAEGYAPVVAAIRKAMIPPGMSASNGKKDSCLEDLYITNPIADKQRIEDDKGGLLKDCYSWILYNDNFLQWRGDPEQHLLWVRGDPGKGKTMLLAGLITELEEASDDGVFYFFCQATQPLLRTAAYVLRGLIWSIVCKRPALISYVRKEYDQAGKSVFSNHNAWQALSRILTAILEDSASADFIIIVDALDECTEGREKLIGFISQCSVSRKAKWIISSRNWPDIESQLDGTQSQVRLHLELNHASISNAVLRFVNRKVDQLNSTYDESARVQIRNHLLDNANDTFLWVALVCQELEKPGVNNYHTSNILKRFPAGLNELYARMISDIKERDMHWCRAILAVIAVAIRPLSLQELAAADETLTEWVEDEKVLSNLVTSCGSLLTIREHRVYTVHQSVNDFLRNTPKVLPVASGKNTIDIWNIATETKIDSCPMNPQSDVEYVAWIHTASHPQALLILGDIDISIWGLDTRQRISKLMSLARMGRFLDAVTISRDQTYCAVFQDMKEFLLYSWGSSITVQKIGRFDQHKYVYDATWVGDNSVAICGDFGIEIWDTEAKRMIAHLHGDPATVIRYGKNRQLASLGLENDTLKIWSLDTILSHSEPTTQQSTSIFERFITSSRGRVAVISHNANFYMLSIVVDGRFLHLPKTLQNSLQISLRRSCYSFGSLAFGQGDYFAVPTDRGAIDVFNFDHDKGLYYRERRIGKNLHLAFKHITDYDLIIQFWGQDQIISRSNSIKFWDLKTGKCLRKVSNPFSLHDSISTITADGRIAGSDVSQEVVIWDIMSGKKTQCFDLTVLGSEPFGIKFILEISLSSSDILAISAISAKASLSQICIALGNAKDGTWIRSYSLNEYHPTLNFLTPKLLDTGFGVLGCDMELVSHNDSSQDSEGGSSKDIPTVDAEYHWDPRYLRLSYSKTEAWLMKGSRRVLWIPRQDVDPRLFSIRTDLEAGKSKVTLVHERCLFILTIKMDSI
ncbi:hypothetical protein FVER53590_11729 [Fusarium verticillioides]|nr:hypothetical protein FVER53590_11729 [Fusarium verticillioides]